MLKIKDKEYYHRINNLDIDLCESNHKYIMIHQWSEDFSYRWGIAIFEYDGDEHYWYLKTFGSFSPSIDWYDFGCLVNLGYKWIKDGIFFLYLEKVGK